ncbi:hypothetical protein D4100_07495 [Serratia inhibens]|uniref:Uncharacterized protein n=1 Tax=Serratia inhibens TaxID=2338073 RepID=A0AA92X7E0_9GAMM|nr:hypothetical protein D4100_07495 [Serratia inhibens]
MAKISRCIGKKAKSIEKPFTDPYTAAHIQGVRPYPSSFKPQRCYLHSPTPVTYLSKRLG